MVSLATLNKLMGKDALVLTAIVKGFLCVIFGKIGSSTLIPSRIFRFKLVNSYI